MITLKSIRLRNFRAVREATLKVPDKGLLGIFGPNGAGKSTFLVGTLFTLFGVTPNRSTVGSLRRTGSGKEECSASVVFEHLGQTVEIIRELKGNNNRAEVNIYLDGIPQTVTSVKAADTWIAQRIGIDATGFLTAFIVRQKELDALVTAKPAERKAVIEKLAGIDTINEALKKSRKDENAAKAVLETIPGSEAKIETALAQVQMLSDKVSELKDVKEHKQEELSNLQASLTTLNSKLEELRVRERSINETSSLIQRLTLEQDHKNQTLTRLKYVTNTSQSYDVETLREEHRSLSALLNEKTQQVNVGRVEKAQLESRLTQQQQTLIYLEKEIKDSMFRPEQVEQIQNEILTVDNEIAGLKSDVTVLETKIADMKEKITALSGDHKECPTCNTVLHDVGALVDGFRQVLANYSNEQISKLEEIEQKNLKLASLKSNLRSAQETAENVESLTKLKEETKETSDKVAALPDYEFIVNEINDLNQRKEEITEKGFKAKQYSTDKAEYEQARNDLEKIGEQLFTLQDKLGQEQKLFTTELYNKTLHEQERISREVNSLSNKMNEAYSELSGFESRFSVAQNEWRSAIEQWNRKKELLVAQERKALTTEVIDKFRKDSIASLAPELSDRATELISAITNGAYTEIRLNDVFDVTVVSSTGEEREVSWLSGGEESAVAFALRLAIAFLITGDNPSLLWLDEVLTAQDADRRASMLTTIRSLPIDQILVINHTEEAADIVDGVVTVVPDPRGGSILVDGIVDGIPDVVRVDSLDDIIEEDEEVLSPTETSMNSELDWLNGLDD